MKEHKNPKVLSEGILWMVSAVDDFGVSHLKLKVCYLFFFFLFLPQ
jgi:cytoskeleton-associated protein 5